MAKSTRPSTTSASASPIAKGGSEKEPKAKVTAKKTAESKGPAAITAQQFAVEAARMLFDDKCTDVVVLDIRALSQVTDFVIIGTGTSDRQMRSVLDHLEELGGTIGFRAFRTNADDRASWLLADFVDAIVHLFEPNTRAHYDLEMLWGDAPRIEWERPESLPRNRAGLSKDDGTFSTRR